MTEVYGEISNFPYFCGGLIIGEFHVYDDDDEEMYECSNEDSEPIKELIFDPNHSRTPFRKQNSLQNIFAITSEEQTDYDPEIEEELKTLGFKKILKIEGTQEHSYGFAQCDLWFREKDKKNE